MDWTSVIIISTALLVAMEIRLWVYKVAHIKPSIDAINRNAIATVLFQHLLAESLKSHGIDVEKDIKLDIATIDTLMRSTEEQDDG